MTVAELIEILKRMPQDVPVVAYDASEDYSELTAEGVGYSENHRWWRDERHGWIPGKCVTIIGGD